MDNLTLDAATQAAAEAKRQRKAAKLRRDTKRQQDGVTNAWMVQGIRAMREAEIIEGWRDEVQARRLYREKLIKARLYRHQFGTGPKKHKYPNLKRTNLNHPLRYID